MEDRKPGWRESCIGPGKPIDTNRFFVARMNNLGGCKGNSGPNTKRPGSDKYRGPDFPIVTVSDRVNSQQWLMRAPGIKPWLAVIGGSLGGMQVMQWSIDYPDSIRHAIVIAASARLAAQRTASKPCANKKISIPWNEQLSITLIERTRC